MTAETLSAWRSPLLDRPGAVAADGPDAGVAAHYGDPLREQKALLAGDGFVDLSHRAVLRISGADRLGWLHSLTTQQLEDLPTGVWTTTLVLSPQGHVEYAMNGYDDGEAWLGARRARRSGRACRLARLDAVHDARRGGGRLGRMGRRRPR